MWERQLVKRRGALLISISVGSLVLFALPIFHLTPAGADGERGAAAQGSIAQLTLYDNSLSLIRDVLTPSTPASAPAGVQAVDVAYCGRGASSSEARLVAIVAPVQGTARLPRVLDATDANMPLSTVALKALNAYTSVDWVVVVPITATWRPWRLEFISGHGAAAVRGGGFAQQANETITALEGRPAFESISTRDFPLEVSPGRQVHVDVGCTFSDANLALTAAPSVQAGVSTVPGPALTPVTIHRDRAANAAIFVTQDWINSVALEAGVRFFETPAGQIGVSSLKVEASNALKVSGLATVDGADEYSVEVAAQPRQGVSPSESDLLVDQVKVEAVSAGGNPIRRRIVASLLSIYLTTLWRDRAVRPVDKRPLALRIGTHAVAAGAEVASVVAQPGAVVFHMKLSQGGPQ